MDPLTDDRDADGTRGEPAPIVGFVTGKLAEPALQRTLARLAPELDFEPRVIRLEIAVAALMTAEWVARRLTLPDGTTRVVLPGFCRGDPGIVAAATGARVELGPRDLRDLPAWLGRAADTTPYGDGHSIEIVAEINHVPQLEVREVVEIAHRYRADGADVIDLGCDPGGPFERIGEYVAELRREGLRVSVDSLDPREIRPAVEAGAELVLSVNASNIDVARDLGAEVVVIPDEPSSLRGLDESVARLEGWGTRYRLDPVLEPIGFGFARSLARYVETRDRFPEAQVLMGVGNLTELTGADSAAINVVLLGFAQELDIASILTTEVIHWARSAVAECDLARRLVHHAVTHHTLPKHLDARLHLLRDPAVRRHGPETLAEIAAGIRDANFRLFAEDGEIHAMNRDGHRRGTDPFALFDELGVSDASHAFYLGYEMAKAVTALTLGKNYDQDRALRWGFLTREEDGHRSPDVDPASEERRG